MAMKRAPATGAFMSSIQMREFASASRAERLARVA
jgi:hypothetical protein